MLGVRSATAGCLFSWDPRSVRSPRSRCLPPRRLRRPPSSPCCKASSATGCSSGRGLRSVASSLRVVVADAFFSGPFTLQLPITTFPTLRRSVPGKTRCISGFTAMLTTIVAPTRVTRGVFSYQHRALRARALDGHGRALLVAGRSLSVLAAHCFLPRPSV